METLQVTENAAQQHKPARILNRDRRCAYEACSERGFWRKQLESLAPCSRNLPVAAALPSLPSRSHCEVDAGCFGLFVVRFHFSLHPSGPVPGPVPVPPRRNPTHLPKETRLQCRVAISFSTASLSNHPAVFEQEARCRSPSASNQGCYRLRNTKPRHIRR
jgi:hypothetical protein